MILVNRQPQHYLARFEVFTVVWMKAFQRHFAPEDDKLKNQQPLFQTDMYYQRTPLLYSAQHNSNYVHKHNADNSSLLPCYDVKLGLLI